VWPHDVESFQGSTFYLFAMAQPWKIGVCWIDQVFVTELTVVIFFCSMSAYIRKTDGVYISVPQKKLKHGRQNITLHWINGIIRNNKCIISHSIAKFRVISFPEFSGFSLHLNHVVWQKCSACQFPIKTRKNCLQQNV
jgi:hypothetical protein